MNVEQLPDPSINVPQKKKNVQLSWFTYTWGNMYPGVYCSTQYIAGIYLSHIDHLCLAAIYTRYVPGIYCSGQYMPGSILLPGVYIVPI